MSVFKELFVSIYYSLREMKENKCEPRFNNETSAKAGSLFKFSFITTLVITRNILDYLMPVTRKLKTKDSDIAQSIDIIKSLKLTIEKLRNNSDLYKIRGMVLQVSWHTNLISWNLKWLQKEFVSNKFISKIPK